MALLASVERNDFRLENIRGPQLRLKPHKEACNDSDLKAYHREYSKQPLAIDLFSGAGGLSLGLQRAGFRLLAGIDKDSFAVETHAAHFPGISLDSDISSEETLEELLEPMRGRRVDLLAGGPPCQPFSKAIRWIRAVQSDGSGSLRDHRRELWQSFLYAAELLRPNAILMENVTDIATNEDGVILRAIFSRLEQLGYSYDCRSYFAYELGVPQHRQRIFIVAFKRSNAAFKWPDSLGNNQRPTLRDAIYDLPPLSGGWDEIAPSYGGPLTPFQKQLREGFDRNDFTLFDHVTRAVRADDLNAFKLLTDKSKYYDLPEELRRYGAESFVDKYNRLSWDEPCRGITAHLGKDGYWYIHPEQHRSLSIREAARVQSFPDWFRFAGFRTSALRQIGEAVAPVVAEALARKVLEHLNFQSAKLSSARSRDTHAQLRGALKLWYRKESKKNSIHPWRLETELWTNLMGETVFADRLNKGKAIHFWANYVRDWPSPKSFLKDRHRESHLRSIGLASRLPVLEALARFLSEERTPALKDLVALGISERLARRAMAICGCSLERPNDQALVRVANRVFERKRSSAKLVASQITTAMLVGEDKGALLYSAAIELGETICSGADPACMLCPISKHCAHYRSSN
jgi:DNA (cytosine-5)-methyltransferase 1